MHASNSIADLYNCNTEKRRGWKMKRLQLHNSSTFPALLSFVFVYIIALITTRIP